LATVRLNGPSGGHQDVTILLSAAGSSCYPLSLFSKSRMPDEIAPAPTPTLGPRTISPRAIDRDGRSPPLVPPIWDKCVAARETWPHDVSHWFARGPID